MIQKKTRVSAALALGSALALAGCETVAESVDETYSASLSGAQEVQGPGDTDGSGHAEITVVDAVDKVCYDINVSRSEARRLGNRGACQWRSRGSPYP